MITRYKLLRNQLISFLFIILTVSIVFAHQFKIVDGYAIPKSYVIIFGSVLTFFTYLVFNILDKQQCQFHLSFVEIILCLMFLWVIITTSQVWKYREGLPIFCELAMIILAFVLHQIIGYCHGYRKRLIYALSIIGLIGVVQALYGLYQLLLVTIMQIDVTKAKTVFLGTIGPANAYGAFIGIGMFSLLSLILTKKEYAYWILSVLPLLLSAFILNRSRGAWFSLLISLTLFFIIMTFRKINVILKRHKYLQYKTVILVSTIVIVAIFLSLVFVVLYKIDPQSAEGRIYAIRVSEGMIRDHPVCGVGLGHFGEKFLHYQKAFLQSPQHISLSSKAAVFKTPNNQYLLTLCESGIVGLVLYFSLLSLSAKCIITRIKENPEQKIYVIILCFIPVVSG